MLPKFFLISIQVLPTVLQPALLCMQFADSAGNIAAGALIHANTLFYFIFPEFSFFLQRDSQRQRFVSCNRHMQSLMLHYLKGLLAPFCLSSKRYKIPFCNLPKVISYRMQNPKNPRLSNSFLQPAKRSLIVFRAIAKGN